MKHILYFAAAISASFILAACQQQVEEEIAPVLDFSTDVVSVANTGGSSSFDINANNDWTAEVGASESWFIIDRTSGTSGSATVNVTVDECTSHRPRIGCVIVRSAGLVKQVSIAQVPAPNNDKIEVNPAELEFTYAAAEKDITLTANVDWTASVDADWVTLSTTSGKSSTSAATIKVTVSENAGKNNRNAVISIEGGDAPKVEIPVFQEAFESIVLDPTQIAFESAGGKETISVEANVDWTATSSASWLKIDKASGSRNVPATVTVTAEANAADAAREATITFKGGTVAQEVVKVSQKGHKITVVTLMSFKTDDPAYTDTHSPDWSTPGANDYSKGTGKGIALPEEAGSTGYMQWVSGGVFVYTASKPLTYITAKEGHFAVKPVFTDDAFEFHIPVTSVPAGSTLRMQTGLRGVAACPMYWAFKFSVDGGKTWITGESNSMQTAKNGEVSNAQITAANKTFTVDAWGTITDAVSSGEIIARMQCVDGTWQVQGKSASEPTAGATVRLTPFTDKDNNSQLGPIITLEY